MNSVRTQLFQGLSMETTARDASRFLEAKSLMPKGVSVNIAFISRETFEERLAAIKTLRACGVSPRPIISARRLISGEVLRGFLSDAVKEDAIRGVFLVGGDPSTPQGPFTSSMDVIDGHFLDALSIETVGIAGYPEGHPRIRSEVLWRYLRLKVDALLTKGFNVEITTQLSFDIDAVICWIERVRSMRINVPIRIGVPSPSTLLGIMHFAEQCRVGTSVQLLQHYGWQITSLLSKVGPERFLTVLLQQMEQRDLGDVRLHIFPLGEIGKAVHWFQEYEKRRLT